jgi:hypothetical protein
MKKLITLAVTLFALLVFAVPALAWQTWTIKVYNANMKVVKVIKTKQFPWKGNSGTVYYRGKDGLSIESFMPSISQSVEITQQN